ncbi:MAG: cytochrome c biogenesis protein ResB, partial [Opitutaceae bacterium]
MNRRTPVRSAIEAFSSLRLTIVLLALSILLIFAATLDQVNLGVWGVQVKYFHSFLVWDRIPGTGLKLPIFPGGYLLGGMLLVNLIAAHVQRFRFSMKKAGIWLTHLGLILLLVGQGVSGLLQRDGQMRLDVGATRRYSESFRDVELALIDTTNPAYDDVVAIPSSFLAAGRTVQHPRLPFLVKPIAYFPNAVLRMRSSGLEAAPSVATAGLGADVAVEPAPVTTKDNEANWPAGYVELVAPDGSLGVWLVSTMFAEPQTFAYRGRTWRIVLRAKRDYLPFSLTLL